MTPYFPKAIAPQAYFCYNCQAWYRVPEVAVSCCVLHPPGSCCHMGEERIPAESTATNVDFAQENP